MPDRSSARAMAAPTGPSEPPTPGDRPAGPPGPPFGDDHPDPAADWPEEPPSLEDTLDPLDDWPDDAPLPDDPDEAIAPPDPDPGDLDVPDDDDGDLLLDDPVAEDDAASALEALEPIVLPWRTRAHLPDHDRTVEAVLDPTAARTRWSGGRPGPLRIELGEVEALVEPEIVDGPPMLRVGRDALSGRILVES